MKIAIHNRIGSFSEEWIKYCDNNNLKYTLVSAYDNDIIEQLQDFDWFFWHHNHTDYRDQILAKKLICALSYMNVNVFPNINSCWHFDDKISQKYLFEAMGIQAVPTWVFYEKNSALEWLAKTSLPKVFKLSGGAGSSNVKLITSKNRGASLIKKAFAKGFPAVPYLRLAYDKFKLFLVGKGKLIEAIRYFVLWLIPLNFNSKLLRREKGYAYFQEFIPNNETDTRIIVVGDKIIGERRGVRKGDFRASGSQNLLPNHLDVDLNCVKISHDIARKLKLQIGVFDFVHKDNSPLLVEVSFGTDPDYTECEGYWDSEFVFHRSHINLSEMIIEYLLNNR